MISLGSRRQAQWHQHHLQGRATGLLRPRDQMEKWALPGHSQLRTAVAADAQWPGCGQNCHFPSSGHTSNTGPTRERGAPLPTHTCGPCQPLRASPSPTQVSATPREGVTPHWMSISAQPLSPRGASSSPMSLTQSDPTQTPQRPENEAGIGICGHGELEVTGTSCWCH